MSDTETEAKPDHKLYLVDRPSARTPEDREAAFQRYLELTEKYDAAIVAAGDEPWHKGDIEARRELYMRRHEAPKAPLL